MGESLGGKTRGTGVGVSAELLRHSSSNENTPYLPFLFKKFSQPIHKLKLSQ